jgi:hypothetical protein
MKEYIVIGFCVIWLVSCFSLRGITSDYRAPSDNIDFWQIDSIVTTKKNCDPNTGFIGMWGSVLVKTIDFVNNTLRVIASNGDTVSHRMDVKEVNRFYLNFENDSVLTIQGEDFIAKLDISLISDTAFIVLSGDCAKKRGVEYHVLKKDFTMTINAQPRRIDDCSSSILYFSHAAIDKKKVEGEIKKCFDLYSPM